MPRDAMIFWAWHVLLLTFKANGQVMSSFCNYSQHTSLSGSFDVFRIFTSTWKHIKWLSDKLISDIRFVANAVAHMKIKTSRYANVLDC